jgi:hypothetical protein
MRIDLCKKVVFAGLFVLVSGCGTNPTRLKAPEQLTCVYLNEALEFSAIYGLLDVKWTTRLERGPYWSEKRDKNGTYYRAPAGGLFIAASKESDFGGGTTIYDGGFYVPDNPNKPITTYRYFGFPNAQVRVPAPSENCNSLVFDGTPDAKKVPRINAGGVIASVLVNAEVGQIMPGQEIKDEKFMKSLRKAVSDIVVIKSAKN